MKINTLNIKKRTKIIKLSQKIILFVTFVQFHKKERFKIKIEEQKRISKVW